MRNRILTSLLFLFACLNLTAQKKLPPKEWIKTIEDIMPSETTVKADKRKVLLFSLATGYKHYVIPYVDEVMKSMATKTGAFDVTVSHDIEMFSEENLSQFDAIILNNTCSDRKERNLFRDVLINKMDKFGKKYADVSLEDRAAKAAKFEKNLIKYVNDGKGLMILHGAINILNKSMEISDMMGGSFHYHPKFQKILLKLVEANHPLTKAFENESITYEDEPYILNGAYAKMNFRPLLIMDTDKLVKIKDSVKEMPRYMAWIKKHGKGRILFSSPGHSHTTYENKKFLNFYLDGLQYVLGDLKCDDSVKK
ncbi:MAG: ThuA domain-containing protein [Lentisphaeraceae bacterium]|nr:ThuA domain-containing protein [Lentisphaeraceae bacterium]